MKTLPFTIPNAKNQSLHLQRDSFEHFYAYLHRHPEIQITQIIKGKGILLAGHDVFQFEKEDIFIIASNVSHVFKNDPEHIGVESLSIFFSPSPSENSIFAIPEFHEIALFLGNLYSCQKVDPPLNNRISTFITELFKTSEEVARVIKFQEIILALFRKLKTSQITRVKYSEKDGDIMQTIIDFTLKNFDKEVSVSKIASLIGYTPEAFCRFFKKRTGKTYMRYINELRINKATQMILSSDQPINEIAFAAGYNNVTHFNRIFKQLKSTNPRTYKKKIIEKL